jgi:hypothetical protein
MDGTINTTIGKGKHKELIHCSIDGGNDGFVLVAGTDNDLKEPGKPDNTEYGKTDGLYVEFAIGDNGNNASVGLAEEIRFSQYNTSATPTATFKALNRKGETEAEKLIATSNFRVGSSSSNFYCKMESDKSSFNKLVEINEGCTFASNRTITNNGTLTNNGTITITKGAYITTEKDSTFTVKGKFTAGNDIITIPQEGVGDNIKITRDTTFSNCNLTVGKKITTTDLEVTGTGTITLKNLTVSSGDTSLQKTTVNGNFTASGAINLKSNKIELGAKDGGYSEL